MPTLRFLVGGGGSITCEVSRMRLPTLIVVAGRPAVGKTTLAHALARAIRCPAICRDEIKEGLVNALRANDDPDGAIALKTYETFFETLRLLLGRQVTLVAEASFQHKLWAPKLEPLREVADVRIVLCEVELTLARRRYVERGLADPARERFHTDPREQAARAEEPFPIPNYDRPHLDVPTLKVDTSDGYNPSFEAIVSFALRTTG